MAHGSCHDAKDGLNVCAINYWIRAKARKGVFKRIGANGC